MNKTVSTLAATGVLVAALSACSIPTAGAAAPAATGPQGAPAASTTVQRDAAQQTFSVSQAAPAVVPQGSSDDPYERVLYDAEALQPIMDEFWTEELAYYGLEFDTPDRFEYYVGDGNGTCGGEYSDGTDNAYYCAVDGDEHVAFDVDWLASYLDEHPGDAVTFLVLAHEWGHAVQDTWVEQQPGVDYWEGPAQELNADCLAGVFWENGLRTGTIIEEDGDAEAVFGWLESAGSGDWMDPGDHGTAEQRQIAFSDGFENGLDYCRINY
ncbi:neutral zinc metallopeptidase [Pseudonocardia humida]|uniref:Neutral zinc metallopeptidase n=1 Tax=Pseudonocardia humida TaxID=2800819 RepID=A0ABT0ZTR0_9PSEU|nr:neutral zinc metallopeptidase [Pseudonocardia humida]MCO1654078.1 neutral zinc metallopeptidase [Pseudonocardia humida]